MTVSKNDFSILYQTVGKGTQLLSGLRKGDERWIIGPLGNGFSKKPKEKNLVLVGGGVGIPPLYHLAKELLGLKSPVSKKNIHVFLGARHKNLLLCQNDFKKLGVKITVATDDGSKGRKGFVTEPLEDFLKIVDLKTTRIFTCGPTPMLRAVSKKAEDFKVPCEVSVEVPMACGFGACLGCAIKVKERLTYGAVATSSQRREVIQRSGGQAATKDLKGYRFAIACCEGPVFEGDKILWD